MTSEAVVMIGTHSAPPVLSTIVTDSAGFVYQTIDGVMKNIAPDITVAEAQVPAVTQGRQTRTGKNRC